MGYCTKKGFLDMKNGRPGRKIICINDGMIFDSIALAAANYNTSANNISKQLMGIRPQAAGRYFMYMDEIGSDIDLLDFRKKKIEEIYNITNL